MNNHIVKISENDDYILKVMYDINGDDYSDPRNNDNLGRMICWHRNYDLGDSHNYGSHREFLAYLADLVLMKNHELIDELVADELLNPQIEKLDDGWAVVNENGEPYNFGYPLTGLDSEYDADMELQSLIENHSSDVVELLNEDELLDIIYNSDDILLLPLFLYDHSGITMNTKGFSSRWDSGQVGYIYALKEDIIEEFGSFDYGKAKNLLESEVSIYDTYIRGEVYGFTLEKKDNCENCGTTHLEHVDSCWGFLGLDSLTDNIEGYIGREHKNLIENLTWAN